MDLTNCDLTLHIAIRNGKLYSKRRDRYFQLNFEDAESFTLQLARALEARISGGKAILVNDGQIALEGKPCKYEIDSINGAYHRLSLESLVKLDDDVVYFTLPGLTDDKEHRLKLSLFDLVPKQMNRLYDYLRGGRYFTPKMA